MLYYICRRCDQVESIPITHIFPSNKAHSLNCQWRLIRVIGHLVHVFPSACCLNYDREWNLQQRPWRLAWLFALHSCRLQSHAPDLRLLHSPSLVAVWASYQIRKIAGWACAGNAGDVFPRHRLQRKPLISDHDTHHGMCVTHVPWCMSGSLTRGGGENVPGIPGACTTCNFTYLVRDPWLGVWDMTRDWLLGLIVCAIGKAEHRYSKYRHMCTCITDADDLMPLTVQSWPGQRSVSIFNFNALL